jgi:hypothetical protein
MSTILSHPVLWIWPGVLIGILIIVQGACRRKGAPFWCVLADILLPFFEFAIVCSCYALVPVAYLLGTEKWLVVAHTCLVLILGMITPLVPEIKRQGNPSWRWLLEILAWLLYLPTIARCFRKYLHEAIDREIRYSIGNIRRMENGFNLLHRVFELYKEDIGNRKIRRGESVGSVVLLLNSADPSVKYRELLGSLGPERFAASMKQMHSDGSLLFPNWPMSQDDRRSSVCRRRRQIPVLQERRSWNGGRRRYDRLFTPIPPKEPPAKEAAIFGRKVA